MRIIYIHADRVHASSLPLCACIGYFDGMHKGHQKLIEATVAMARRKNCESAMITFDPDPWVTVRGIENVRHITTMRQRMNKAVSLGIDNFVILRFTKEMSRLSADTFVSDILGQLNLKGIVCGFDFHYGHEGKGNTDTLTAAAPYEVEVVGAVTDEKGKISSTRISECIEKGDIPSANRMLGYEFRMEGVVIHGRHKGTGMGFPTANIRISSEYILPRSGVYACYAEADGVRYRAMANIGHNPTMNYSEDISLEAHLMRFSGNLYGKMVSLCFVEYLRPEKRFQNRNNLIMQLEQDTRDVGKILDAYEQSLSAADTGTARK